MTESEKLYQVPGFDHFFCTMDGKIWSTKSNKFLKPMHTKEFYERVKYYIPGITPKWIPVHRLVMITFVGPVPLGLEINHKDGNKKNNKLENLEYVSRSENKKHAFRIGLIDFRGTKGNQRTSLTEKTVKKIKQSLEIDSHHQNLIRLANKYKVTTASIYNIKSGKTWKHV